MKSLTDQINDYIEDNRAYLFYNDIQFLLQLKHKLEYHAVSYDEVEELFEKFKNQIEYRASIKERRVRQKKLLNYPLDL